jgi:outer membrane autotransporter protein
VRIIDQDVKFSAVDSHRVRVGTRYTTATNEASRFYVGAAWEHEFDGEANAKVDGAKIEAPSLKGNTGIAEFGVVLVPIGNKNLTIDLGIQGYGGKHRGATGSAQLKYVF